MTASHPSEPSTDATSAAPDGETVPTTRHLAHLMRQHDKLARLAVEQDSHKLPEYADTISLLTVVEAELQERYPHAYDALLPVWLTRNTHVGHEPGRYNPACTICAARRSDHREPIAA